MADWAKLSVSLSLIFFVALVYLRKPVLTKKSFVANCTSELSNRSGLADNEHTTRVNMSLHDGLSVRSGVCAKGQPNWDKQWLVSELPTFLKVYNTRLGDNLFGTQIMHQFALWCIIRRLKPKHIIESGIHRGLGTWILRQAAPNAQLILLDPAESSRLTYKDNHSDTLYFTGENFRDFKTLSSWDDVILNTEQTLAFIDDHNTPFTRIPQARQAGIKHLIFDDNYWLGFYDCLSLKQGCACVLQEPECSIFNYKDEYGKINRNLTEQDLRLIHQTFRNISVYYEFPMIWNVLNPNLLSLSANTTNYIYGVSDGRKLLSELGLVKLPARIHRGGLYTYFNIAYVKLL